jgi:dihydrofolate reductase
LVTSLINYGLLDQLRLIVHPVAVGGGKAIFEGVAQRQALELLKTEPAASGRVNLTYRLRPASAAAALRRQPPDRNLNEAHGCERVARWRQ